MIYRRVTLHVNASPANPIERFVYALKFNDVAPQIEVGLGVESMGGLQRTHIAGAIIPHQWAEERAQDIAKRGIKLRTKKLAPLFHGCADFLVENEPSYLGEDEEGHIIWSERTGSEMLADAIREVHAEGWPNDVQYEIPDGWKDYSYCDPLRHSNRK